MPEEDQQLQDLSHNDAEELQAFVAKRKWFELKLKELESHVPIYPFVNVKLDPSVHTVNDIKSSRGSYYHLPSFDQVTQWQAERDAIEEEVVSFDGGDLGRMKQKTRAVTLVPLTPPSTELVEVTLDLIVVVDRLLTLLRHRSELLELTKLRLQWDAMRLTCQEEIQAIRHEVQSIVMKKCEWFPTTSGPGRSSDHHLEPTTSETPTSPPSRSQNSGEIPSTPLRRTVTSITTPHCSPKDRHTGSPAVADTPKRGSLKLTLLHSQIVNIRIRHTTFSTTSLPRLGVVLDKMIDIAGPLKGLGGINGPPEQGEDGEGDGAVPEKLLDAQDELEALAAAVGEDVHWCQQMELQCVKAERLHLLITRIHLSATEIVSRLAHLSALSKDGLDSLKIEWQQVSAEIPSAVDKEKFNLTPKVEYPQNATHETEVIEILEQARRRAQLELSKGDEALQWMYLLLDQQMVVDHCCHELATRQAEIAALLDRIPNPSTPADEILIGVDAALFADIETWDTQATKADRGGPNISQRSVIVGMKYRAIAKNPPSGLDTTMSASCEASLSRLNDLNEVTKSQAQLLRQSRDRLLLDRVVSRLTDQLRESGGIINQQLQAEATNLARSIELALWDKARPTDMPNLSDMDRRLSYLGEALRDELVDALADLVETAGSNDRYQGLIQASRGYVTAAQSTHARIGQYRALLDRVILQTSAVQTIKQEVNRLLENIGEVVQKRSNIESIQQEVASWLDSIAGRVPFLSTDWSKMQPVDDVGEASITGRPVQVQNTFLPTPPECPTPTADARFDLRATDQAIRIEINELTATVSSALERALGVMTLRLPSTETVEQYPRVPSSITQRDDASKASAPLVTSSGRVPRSCKSSLANSARQLVTPSDNGTRYSSPLVRPRQSMPGTLPMSMSLNRAAGKSIASRRVSSTSISSSQSHQSMSFSPRLVDTPNMSREDSILARSISNRSLSLGRSAGSNPLARRVLSASSTASSSQIRIATPRQPSRPAPSHSSRRSVRKYVPDPSSQLDVAVGDIVNGLKVHVPIVPVGATARDEYKDMTGSYWIGAEGRAKLCFCRILRSRTVMVRVGGGWSELTSFIAEHFPESDIEVDDIASEGMLGLSLDAPNSKASPGLITPIRSRVASFASISGESPASASGSPRQAGDDTTSPLTPLRFIKKASDSPDARKKEKEDLRIGRRSILGKE